MHKHTLLHIPSLSSILEITLFIYGVCYIFSVFRVLAAMRGGLQGGGAARAIKYMRLNLIFSWNKQLLAGAYSGRFESISAA